MDLDFAKLWNQFEAQVTPTIKEKEAEVKKQIATAGGDFFSSALNNIFGTTPPNQPTAESAVTAVASTTGIGSKINFVVVLVVGGILFLVYKMSGKRGGRP